jgi:hypothetical protein
MSLPVTTSARYLRTFAVGLVLATVLAAPSLGAIRSAVRPDDRPGVRAASSPLVGTAQRPYDVRPDDRAGTRGSGAVAVTNTSAPTRTGSGFDWADAGVGAGLALALCSLGAAAMSRRRLHRPDEQIQDSRLGEPVTSPREFLPDRS